MNKNISTRLKNLLESGICSRFEINVDDLWIGNKVDTDSETFKRYYDEFLNHIFEEHYIYESFYMRLLDMIGKHVFDLTVDNHKNNFKDYIAGKDLPQ